LYTAFLEVEAMARKHETATARRQFLSDASKYGVVLVGAACGAGGAAAQEGGGGAAPKTRWDNSDEEAVPVAEKAIIRVLGVVQRRAGLTRLQVKFRSPGHDFSAADRAVIAGQASGITTAKAEIRRPTGVGEYYRWVYADVLRKEPGRNTRHIHNVVLDGAYGEGLACTAFGNRDLVSEMSYEEEGQKPAGAARPEPTPPDILESGTAMNLAVQQVFGEGTRPAVALGGEKVIHFLKLSAAGASRDPVQVWKTLHAKALATAPAFGGALQGHELSRRLADSPARQTMRCGGVEMTVPDLVACFWLKKADGGAAWENYARTFRYADADQSLDLSASFFLIVQEYRYS
jgi:hypothetical protein